MLRRDLTIALCATALCSLAFAGSAQAAPFVVDNLGDASDMTPDGSCDTDGGPTTHRAP